TRKYLYQELEARLTPEEYDEWIEKNFPLWKPPYDKTEEEMLEMLNSAMRK
ncbi:hypothetical protein KDM68_004547, partial [Salmonella enterica subsp. enterica serovar Cerro]|nr:hypothetical protein [Salmonella enterica subsp. enterica serovar Cerro]EHZ9314670.1 hypothetical protein [Salmonella enterica]EID0750909.1 hypothetical protein [Salmonella enterica subsp. enterica serovar Uganda]EKE0897500.1 hypothetical protein [Salmonella enterica subsp. enterica serovar Muenchen]ELM0865004.1 hypothetical protein [Salmonella enterica subsp. enterica serovar Saintpaul]